MEWLAAAPGAGALASALQMMARNRGPHGESWRSWIPPRSAMHPRYPAGASVRVEHSWFARTRRHEACWAIEQCLRCPGVSAVWAWVEPRLSHARSSPLAVGGGSGRRRGHHLPAGDGAARTRLGRLTFARHALGRAARAKPDGCGSTSSITGAVWEVPPRSGRSTMPRVLCVWFPRWPIQRLRNEQPELRRSELVLFAGQQSAPPGHGRVVTKAERRGVRVGQPLAEAKALIPEGRLPSRRCRRGSRGPVSTGARWSPLLAPGRSGRRDSSRIAALST